MHERVSERISTEYTADGHKDEFLTEANFTEAERKSRIHGIYGNREFWCLPRSVVVFRI